MDGSFFSLRRIVLSMNYVYELIKDISLSIEFLLQVKR